MEGGVEAPVVEEPGPVEDVGDVGEAQEAVQPDQLVDGGGAGLRPDHGQDGEDEDKHNDSAEDSEAEEPGGGEGEGGHPLTRALLNWGEMWRGTLGERKVERNVERNGSVCDEYPFLGRMNILIYL